MPKLKFDYPGAVFRKQFDDGIEMCRKAIDENPRDAAALANLAHSYIVLWCFGFIPHSEAIPRANAAITKALEIDAKNGLAHVVSGIINESLWKWHAIEPELKLGIEYAPDNALTYNWYANYLYATSRFDEAYAMADKAIALSAEPGYKVAKGAITYFVQDFKRLKKDMLDVIAGHPGYAPAYDWLGMACIQLREFDKSIEAYEKAVELSGGLAEILGGLGHAYGIAGQEQKACSVLMVMQDYADNIYIPPVQIAFVHAGLGDLDNTFKLLERAYDEKSWELIFIRTEPWFGHLQNDSRMKSIIKRMRFPHNI